MRLYLDLGNSRIKWRTEDMRKAGAPAAVLHYAPDFVECLAALPDGMSQVLVSSVTHPERERALQEAVGARWSCRTSFARSTAILGGVTNGYRQPDRLGVDRWLAIVAAAQGDLPALVVDAGTAMTVDAVDAEHRHLGGYIVPGTRLMVDALEAATARVRVGGADLPPVPTFGCDTTEAVLGGVAASLAGLIEHAYRQLAGDGPCRLVLTGGASFLLKGHLSLPSELMADLVLDGLVFWAQEHASGC